MPEPFLPQGVYYCCVQKNLIDFRAFCQDWAPLALGWDRIPSQAQVACFCRQQNTNIQLKLNIYCTFPLLVSVCVCVGLLGSLVAAGGQFLMCSAITLILAAVFHQRQLID